MGITEADEQKLLFEWAEFMGLKYPALRLMFHIPNGGSRNVVEAKNLKRQGVKTGVPDIFLPAARGGYHGLFIEMKRSDGGRVSAAQADYIKHLKMQGYQALVCNGCDAAASVIKAYMEGDE